MINPELMCDKHLLGEHGEIHKFRHVFVKGYKISGRLSPIVQIEPLRMKERHDELAEEMIRREMNHKSPYEQPDLSKYGDVLNVKTNIDYNISDLSERCEECRKRIINFGEKT